MWNNYEHGLKALECLKAELLTGIYKCMVTEPRQWNSAIRSILHPWQMILDFVLEVSQDIRDLSDEPIVIFLYYILFVAKLL